MEKAPTKSKKKTRYIQLIRINLNIRIISVESALTALPQHCAVDQIRTKAERKKSQAKNIDNKQMVRPRMRHGLHRVAELRFRVHAYISMYLCHFQLH